jgi:hypothetical protein
MSPTWGLRTEILDLIDEIWELQPDLSLGRLLHEVLQPPERIEALRELDDRYLAAALDSYLSVLEIRASPK